MEDIKKKTEKKVYIQDVN